MEIYLHFPQYAFMAWCSVNLPGRYKKGNLKQDICLGLDSKR